MKLLFDENLAPRLAAGFDADYPGSTHVHLAGLGSAPDEQVWRFAQDNGYTIVTKDADYHERSLIAGYPPKVIWVRRGNASTDEVAAILRDFNEAIGRLDANDDLGVLVI